MLADYPRAAPVLMVVDDLKADVLGSEAVGIPGILVRRCERAARYSAADLRSLPPVVHKATREAGQRRYGL